MPRWFSFASALLIGLPLSAVACESWKPAGRGGYLLPSGYLSVRGSQFVDREGNYVRIAGIGWNGTDGPAGRALNGLYAANYQTILDSIKADGFNAVRIPWTDANLRVLPATDRVRIDYRINSDLKGLTNFEIFQKVVDYASIIGLKVIFDHHTNEGCCGQQPNGLWIDRGPGTDESDGKHSGTVDFDTFSQNWRQFAQAFGHNATVIGFDLHNEPSATGHVTWGGDGPTDIRRMCTTIGNMIQNIAPDQLIICEATGTIRNIGQKITENPLALSVSNKVVYSFHNYPNEILNSSDPDSGADFVEALNAVWGIIYQHNLAPVWIGELGSSLKSEGARLWAASLISYMNGKIPNGPQFRADEQPVSGSWWLAGTGSDEPNGIQTAWGLDHYRPEQQVITDQMLFTPKSARRCH